MTLGRTPSTNYASSQSVTLEADRHLDRAIALPYGNEADAIAKFYCKAIFEAVSLQVSNHT